MAKEIVAHIKLQIPAGQANPAPPVGTALGPRGVNIMAFCKEFNAATQKQAGDILPVVITVYKDKSFTFVTKSPPAAVLLKKAANIAAGSKEPNKTKVGKVTRKQIMDIVKTKAKDLNSRNDEAGFKIIAGNGPPDGSRSSRLAFARPARSPQRPNAGRGFEVPTDSTHPTNDFWFVVLLVQPYFFLQPVGMRHCWITGEKPMSTCRRRRQKSRNETESARSAEEIYESGRRYRRLRVDQGLQTPGRHDQSKFDLCRDAKRELRAPPRGGDRGPQKQRAQRRCAN